MARRRVNGRPGAVGAGLAGLAGLVVLVLTAVSGCSSGGPGVPGEAGESTGPARAERADEAEQAAVVASPSVSASRGDGRLLVEYERGASASDRRVQAILQQDKVLEGAADYVNEQLALAYDVPVRAMSCPEDSVSPEWDPEDGEIRYCYEFVKLLLGAFAEQDASGTEELAREKIRDDVIGSTNGVLFHEVGHALVHMYKLPVTGKEEDAVDQLSVVMMANGDEEHQAYAVSTIKAWAGLGALEQRSLNELSTYADAHSLSTQRFFNWTCWLYGSDPKRYADVVKTERNRGGALPRDRAEGCPAEYQQMADSWGVLLKPYIKD